MGKRVIGSNSHGFNNEKLMVSELNGKKLKELNTNLKKFVKNICEDNKILTTDEMIISARVESSNKLKQDFYIVLEGQEFGISTKMGTGNSVHQEKIEDFIEWLSGIPTVKITDEIKDSLRLCIWGDGSVHGQASIKKGKDGKIIGRFDLKGFKKTYPLKRNQIQEFLEKNLATILSRAIFEGNNSSKVDYVYHGRPEDGVWISKKEILEFNIQNPKSKNIRNVPTLSVGRLSVQAWNVSLNGKNEKKRGEIQFKYSSMVQDFESLMLMKASNIGTFEGNKEEFNLSKLMNKNKKHKFWKVLSNACSLEDDKENYYIVKVDGNKESKLTGKKVKCKADCFIIQANLSKDYLLQKEYQITEKDVKDIRSYKIIKNSGISVKRADSQRYTIVKLTNNTFKNAFEKYINEVEFIIVGLLLYSDTEKLHLNKKIIRDLEIKEEDLKAFYLKKFKISGSGILDKDYASKISKETKQFIKEVIETNTGLKASLFTGKGWFDNPYSIGFIFKGGELTNEVYTDYTISNGSGRSKGSYTIILKPQ
ncbi:hypothetical protein [Alkaliphilus peptidifermentans]|uniref:Uncharacterized protein n=1 Tax=Alkaliphilus peptidifermentans DSM 18978 TaxID=1120976 RepID=A0A1G5EJZ3_9FIRM|nr:hypothetical protein [Alkaliphilus peptidifermentans]SCY26738.1 hypothetical protein SAMN03080606_01169 [Alkaliphilus peptidifermentans DSM 18978]